MHYVVGQSGWALGSLVALLVILLLRDCGQRLIGCCEEMQRRGFSSPTYAMIGYEAFGEVGRWLVLALSLIELWCGVVWMNIVSWNNCTLMLAGYPLHWLIFGFLLLASATCWLRTLQHCSLHPGPPSPRPYPQLPGRYRRSSTRYITGKPSQSFQTRLWFYTASATAGAHTRSACGWDLNARTWNIRPC